MQRDGYMTNGPMLGCGVPPDCRLNGAAAFG